MLIGYIRATNFEEMDEQLKAIINFGVLPENIAIDMIVDRSAPTSLDKCLENLKRNDTIVIMTINKLGKNLTIAMSNARKMSEKGIGFVTVALPERERVEPAPEPVKSRRRTTPETLVSIAGMLNQGSTMNEVSKKFRMHPSTIYRYVNSKGVLSNLGRELLKGRENETRTII